MAWIRWREWRVSTGCIWDTLDTLPSPRGHSHSRPRSWGTLTRCTGPGSSWLSLHPALSIQGQQHWQTQGRKRLAVHSPRPYNLQLSRADYGVAWPLPSFPFTPQGRNLIPPTPPPSPPRRTGRRQQGASGATSL